ncbi:MAG: DUF1214 domain-containing protein [Proteobacteria bacterium]|nr:DUF1214 domain-containing protein [Pseudomonadota bacterium]
MPQHFPARDFWSVIVYDIQFRSMLQTEQQSPGVSSQNNRVKVNADGSVEIFGCQRPQRIHSRPRRLPRTLILDENPQWRNSPGCS